MKTIIDEIQAALVKVDEQALEPKAILMSHDKYMELVIFTTGSKYWTPGFTNNFNGIPIFIVHGLMSISAVPSAADQHSHYICQPATNRIFEGPGWEAKQATFDKLMSGMVEEEGKNILNDPAIYAAVSEYFRKKYVIHYPEIQQQ